MVRTCGATGEHSSRLLKMAIQQGRSECRPFTYPPGYVKGLHDARTLLADFFSLLLMKWSARYRWRVGNRGALRLEFCGEELAELGDLWCDDRGTVSLEGIS